MLTIVVKGSTGEKQRFELGKSEVHIGRDESNEVCLPRGNVAKRHAKVLVRNGRVYVADLKTTEGTFVRGKRIEDPVIVGPNDEVAIGRFTLTIAEGMTGEVLDPGAPSKQNWGAIRGELTRRLGALDWIGATEFLARITETEGARGGYADWDTVVTQYVTALELMVERKAPAKIEAQVWAKLSELYRLRLNDNWEANEALRAARSLDPDVWGRATTRPPLATKNE